MKSDYKTIGIIVVILILVAVGVWYFSGAGNTTPSGNEGQSAASLPSTASVSIVESKFEPAELKIKVGDSVTWTNNGKVKHTATFTSGIVANSGTLDPGESFTYTFNKTGTFPYRCSFQSFMKGTIVVE